MEKILFYGDQVVGESDLNMLESDISGNIQDYLLENLTYSSAASGSTVYSVYGGGVLGDIRDNLLSQNLKVSQRNSASVNLYHGIALDASGNLIDVPTDIVVYASGSSTTCDTLSWDYLTNNIYYVKIDYTEEFVTYASGAFSSSGYTRVQPSYIVTVDAIAPVSNEICLAKLTQSLATCTVEDVRSYVCTIIPSWGVSLDPDYVSVSSIKTAYNHVMATGSTTPTLKNPHGISYEDVGALPSGSLSRYGDIEGGAILPNKVYRNGSETIFFDANVESDRGWLYGTPMVGAEGSWSIYVSSAGILTGTGSLIGNIIELARFGSRFTSTTQDKFYFREDLQAFIPPNWYYKVSTTDGYQSPTGSIKFTATYV
jgi:hypothetical protein